MLDLRTKQSQRIDPTGLNCRDTPHFVRVRSIVKGSGAKQIRAPFGVPFELVTRLGAHRYCACAPPSRPKAAGPEPLHTREKAHQGDRPATATSHEHTDEVRAIRPTQPGDGRPGRAAARPDRLDDRTRRAGSSVLDRMPAHCGRRGLPCRTCAVKPCPERLRVKGGGEPTEERGRATSTPRAKRSLDAETGRGRRAGCRLPRSGS